jgi:hypothetical protein
VRKTLSLETMRQYYILDGVVLRVPHTIENACTFVPGEVCFHEVAFQAYLRFPVQLFVRSLLDCLDLAPSQIAPNAWHTILGCMVIWLARSDGNDYLLVDEFPFLLALRGGI